MANGLDSTFNAVASNALKVIFLIGLVVLGNGVLQLTRDNVGQNGQGTKGRAILFIACGAVMMSMTAFSDILSGSLTGGDAAGLDQLRLN